MEQGDDAFLTDRQPRSSCSPPSGPWSGFVRPGSSLSSFLEAAPDAVVIADRDGRIVRVNGQAEKMFGYGREDLAGQEVEVLMPERFRPAHRRRAPSPPRTRPMGPGSRTVGAARKDGSSSPSRSASARSPTRGGFSFASIIGT